MGGICPLNMGGRQVQGDKALMGGGTHEGGRTHEGGPNIDSRIIS